MSISKEYHWLVHGWQDQWEVCVTSWHLGMYTGPNCIRAQCQAD